MNTARISPLAQDLSASNKEIVKWCRDPKRIFIDGKPEYGVKVIRKGHFAIKYGNIHPEEARNQQEAYRLLDPSTVRVPFVYRFFTAKIKRYNYAYLVMEYIPSARPSKPYTHTDVMAITKAILHMQSFQQFENPGPVGGGRSRGLIYDEETDESDLTFATMADMQDYLNTRIRWRHVDLTGTRLVFSHCDIAPRNIIFAEGDNELCIIDWASGGYYPRYFEYFALLLSDPAARPCLAYDVLGELKSQAPLDEAEQAMLSDMHSMWWNMVQTGTNPWYPRGHQPNPQTSKTLRERLKNTLTVLKRGMRV